VRVHVRERQRNANMSREDLGVEGGDACDVRRLIECAVVTALALVKEDDDAGARVEIEGEEGKAGGCAGPAWKVVHSQVRVCANARPSP
jgi:hypothetical protein